MKSRSRRAAVRYKRTVLLPPRHQCGQPLHKLWRAQLGDPGVDALRPVHRCVPELLHEMPCQDMSQEACLQLMPSKAYIAKMLPEA